MKALGQNGVGTGILLAHHPSDDEDDDDPHPEHLQHLQQLQQLQHLQQLQSNGACRGQGPPDEILDRL